MRHYDVANRTRNRFTGQVDVVAERAVDVQRLGRRRQGRLRRQLLRPAGVDVPDVLARRRLPAAERLRRRRHATTTSATPACSNRGRRVAGGAGKRSACATGPRTRRSACITSRSTPRRRGSARNTEARFSYDYSYAEGNYLYAIVPAGRCRRPIQLPDVFNKLQQLHIDVRHRLSSQLAATFSYLYEPFRVYDFAFDQTVVNSIVQPSSLVLGYVYRPYTAHSAVFGLRYFW